MTLATLGAKDRYAILTSPLLQKTDGSSYMMKAIASWPAPSRLIPTGRDHHDWQSTTPFLRKLLADTGRSAVRVEEEPAGITAGTLAKYDVVIPHYNGPR